MLQHAFHGLWGPDMVAVRADLAHDLLASAQAAEDRALEFWANLLLLHVSFETGDFARAKVARDRQQELAAALAQPTLSWVAQVGVAGWAMLEGDLVAGERLAREALELGNLAGQPDALQIFGEHRALRADLPGPRRRAAHRTESASRRTSTRAWRCGRPRPPSTKRTSATGRRRARSCGRPSTTGLERVGWDTLRLVALSFYAEAASRLQALDAAALVHELMTPWQDQFVWSGALGYGHVRLWLGVAAATMGSDDEADEHFAFACRFHDDNGLSLWSARSHLGWAESLAARGDRAQAQEHAGSRARARTRARLRPDRGPGRAASSASSRLQATDVKVENRR